jgi:hypothetical protein
MEDAPKKRGGFRPGAGRKRGLASIAAEKAREFAIQKIVANIGPILDAQIASAVGVKYVTEDGEIYTQKPDVSAGKNLIDQAIGKAKETVEQDIEVTLKLDV